MRKNSDNTNDVPPWKSTVAVKITADTISSKWKSGMNLDSHVAFLMAKVGST